MTGPELDVFEQVVDGLEKKIVNLKKALSSAKRDFEGLKNGTLSITDEGYQFIIDRFDRLLEESKA